MKKGIGFLIVLLAIASVFARCGFSKSKPTYGNVEDDQMQVEQGDSKEEILKEIKQGIIKEIQEAQALEPVFKNQSIPEAVWEKMQGASWQEGNPVSIDDLSYVQIAYWGFDGKVHQGEIIVHQQLALEVQDIFRDLYDAKFPIEKMILIDEYDADDERSMEDNNTSAFCSRSITGKQNLYSKHSYGVAIDINPVQNPYQKGAVILPLTGEIYLDRSMDVKGMIQEGDPCYIAFVSRGWTWGGSWKEPKDYQHFEKDTP